MQYEVEMKFPVKDREALERIVFQNPGLTVEELDLYFQHPCRDFAKTDEGFRVRCQDYEGGESQCFLTYKGPKIDPETKTRKEIDIPIFRNDFEKLCEMCSALGFHEAGRVRKIRTSAPFPFQGREFHVCLDFLPDLASRNLPCTFFEIETLCDAVDLANARNDIFRFTHSLDAQGVLGESVRKGYLEMILES